MVTDFFSWLMSLINHLGYLEITLLMAVESSLIPFPSEIVMPPAGYLVALGKLNFWLVLLSGTIGSIIGALFNYYLALTLGRKVMHSFARSKWARLILLNEDSLIKAEDYFKANGRSSTFFARFIPAVRQLISLPAGLAKMRLDHFIFYTGLGSGIWVAILTILGYFFGANQALLHSYYKQLSVVGIIIALSFIVYLIKKHAIRKS